MEPHPVRLRLRVAPGAARPAIVGRYGDAWKIRVAARPDRGRANDAVVALLAETLGVARATVHLVAGRSSRDKVVELSGISQQDVNRRLTAGKEPV
jgi:uncharacterized protein (TIGR00251 family)